jgi:hypothetical protein
MPEGGMVMAESEEADSGDDSPDEGPEEISGPLFAVPAEELLCIEETEVQPYNTAVTSY